MPSADRWSSSSASAIAPSSTLSAWRASPPERSTRWSKASWSRATPPAGPNDPARPRSSSSSARRTIVRDVVVAERLEPPHAQARQERRVDLEVRVLGRRADQRDGAVLDVRQERVLLALVEAVDLVDEQDRAAALEREPVLGLGDRRRGPRRRRTSPRTPAGTRRSTASARRRASDVLPVPGGPHSRRLERWPRVTDRRSGPRSPTRLPWPTNSSSVRGRMRAASGCRSGGGRNRGSGRAPGTAPGGHWAMVARAGSGDLEHPGDVDRDVQREQDDQQQDRDPHDVLEVARDVGVLRRVVEGAHR